MSFHGGDYERYEREARALEFDIECSDCGCVYGSLHDGPCPSCGSSSQTYSGADAARWNDHMRRTGR